MNIPRGIRAALLVGLGAAVTWALLALPGRGPGPAYRDVVVDSASITRGEPDPDVGLLEGLARPRAQPIVRATAPGAAVGDVAAFCLAAGFAPVGTDRSAPGLAPPGPAGGAPPGDSPALPAPEISADAPPAAVASAPAAAPVRPPSGLPPALLPRPPAIPLIRSLRCGRCKGVELWGITSAGDAWHQSYDARGTVTATTRGADVVVRGDRLWWIEALAPVAVCAAGAWASLELDSSIPAAAGCALGAALVIR